MTELFDKPAAAAYLGVSIRTLDRLRGLKKLKWIQVSGCVRFRIEDLEHFVLKNTKNASSTSS